VQHVEREGLGLLAEVLEKHGLVARTVRTWRGEPVPRTVAPAPGVIILGGPMSTYEADRHSHLADEIALAADALRRDVPILGVCLGSQILAAAAGGRVYPGPAQEIGWFPIAVTDAGRRDPVLGVFSPEAVVFHWHGDTFDLPGGATLLASSRLYANQAFRIGTRAYGVQFHPEITAGMVDEWVEAGTSESSAFGGAGGGERLRSEARRYAPLLAGPLAEMARAFFSAGGLFGSGASRLTSA